AGDALRGLVEGLDIEEARGRAARVGADRVREDHGPLDDRVALAGEGGDGPAPEARAAAAVLGDGVRDRLLVEDLLALLHALSTGVGVLDDPADPVALGGQRLLLRGRHEDGEEDRAILLD